MRLAVIGASGATGRRVVERALAKGHPVIAVSRRLTDDIAPRDQLAYRAADVRDQESLMPALEGCDAAISTIGPAQNLDPGDLMSVGIRNIISACAQAKVPNFVMQSGITLSDGSELSFGDRLALRPIQYIYRKAIADKRVAEASIRTSNLDWVIVRAAGLKDMPATSTHRVGPHARIALLRPLSFADCADCLVRAASMEADWRGQIINVGM